MIGKALIGVGSLIASLSLTGCAGTNPANAITSQFLLPCPAAHYSYPQWSPDGQRIAFLSSTPPQKTHIYMMNPDGRDVSRVVEHSGDFDLFGWSPDSRMIAFGLGGGLFIANLDGETRRIPIQGAFVTSTSWSPDSQRIAFSEISFEDEYFIDLFVADVSGGEPTRLTYDPEPDTDPDWSPDGDTIAYVRTVGNEQRVMVINADGMGMRAATRGPDSHIDPDWSPDGRQLAYLAIDTETTLMIAAPNGRNAKPLWTIADGTPFQWLPDSKHLSYFSPLPPHDLIIGDTRQLGERTLTPQGQTVIGSFSWSPDGSEVVVITTNPIEMAIIERATGHMRLLTDNPGKYTCFHWPF